jgi:CRP/FNR family cyclic AMP-dependent transcriptional regulator
MITRHSELLTGVEETAALQIRGLGRLVRVAPGDLLFRLGDEATDLYLIERGRVALTLPMRVPNIEEEVLIEERQSGQTLGWSALIPPHRFTLTAKALVDTEVLALPRQKLLDYFDEHPQAGYAVTRNVAAVTGQRLQVFQAMWLREMQRVVRLNYA